MNVSIREEVELEFVQLFQFLASAIARPIAELQIVGNGPLLWQRKPQYLPRNMRFRECEQSLLGLGANILPGLKGCRVLAVVQAVLNGIDRILAQRALVVRNAPLLIQTTPHRIRVCIYLPQNGAVRHWCFRAAG